MAMLNNVVGCWAYIRGGLIFGGGAYIWNEVSVEYMWWAYIWGGAYIWRFTVSVDSEKR